MRYRLHDRQEYGFSTPRRCATGSGPVSPKVPVPVIEEWLACATTHIQRLTETASAPKLPTPSKPGAADLEPFLHGWSPLRTPPAMSPTRTLTQHRPTTQHGRCTPSQHGKKTKSPTPKSRALPDLHVCQISDVVIRQPLHVEAEYLRQSSHLRKRGSWSPHPAPSQHGSSAPAPCGSDAPPAAPRLGAGTGSSRRLSLVRRGEEPAGAGQMPGRLVPRTSGYSRARSPAVERQVNSTLLPVAGHRRLRRGWRCR